MNPLAQYFLVGLDHYFPDITLQPESLPSFEALNPTIQFLLEDPLQQLANARNLPWEAEIDAAFQSARSDLNSRLHQALDIRSCGPTDVTSFATKSTTFRCTVESSEDSIFVMCRPLATEIEILAGYLVSLSAVGVLVALREGDIDVDMAEVLMFRPRTASLFGRLPFGSDLVSGVNELLSDLFCSPPGPLDTSYLESQTQLFFAAVEMYLDNVQSNFSVDPRWALTARVARNISRLQSKHF